MRLAPRVLCCAVVLFWGSLAFAQTEEAKAAAQKRYEEGVALHKKGREEDAYVHFAQAYAVVPGLPILFNLARTEQATGRLLGAAGHFKEFLARSDDPLSTAEFRQKARAFLAEIQAQLGHIAIEAPTGTLLTVDGMHEAAGEVVDVQPGTHAVSGQLGPVSQTVTVACSAGETATAKITFDAPAPASVPAVIEPVASAVVTAPLPTPPSSENQTTRDALRGSAASVAAIGLGLGIGFKVLQYSQGANFNTYVAAHPGACDVASSAPCVHAHALNDQYDTSATVSTVGFVVGGAALLGTAALWFLWPRSARETRAWIVPVLDVAGRRLGVSGSF